MEKGVAWRRCVIKDFVSRRADQRNVRAGKYIVHCRNKMSVKFILVLAVCLAFMSIGCTDANPSGENKTTTIAPNNTAVRFAQTGGVVSLVLLPIALHP